MNGELKSWEEKSYTIQLKNSKRPTELNRDDSMNDIKNKNKEENLKSIIGTIYLITNLVNGNRYVGQTIRKVSWRWTQHIYNSNFFNYPLYKSIKKYGREKFKLTILETTNDLNLLNDLEVKHIREQQSFIDWKRGGYNLNTGGGMKIVVSNQTKQKLSKLHKGIPKTTEHNRKVGLANRGKPNGRMDKTIVNFTNEITNETFIGLRKDFYKKYNLDTRKVYDLIKGRRQTHKGWKSITSVKQQYKS